MIDIRLMKEEDFDQILRMSKQFSKDSDLIDSIGIDDVSLISFLKNLVNSVGGFGLVADDDGKLVGMLGIMILPHVFNNNVLVAEEIAWWVDRDYRKKISIGMNMLRLAEEVMKGYGVKISFMKFLHKPELNPEILEKFYTRVGYKKLETTMMKEF